VILEKVIICKKKTFVKFSSAELSALLQFLECSQLGVVPAVQPCKPSA